MKNLKPLQKLFRKLGFEAYSCDLQLCSGGHPEWHIQGDVLPLLKQHWDMVIGFPPCTYLTNSGNRWFNIDRYGDEAIERYRNREEGIKFFMEVINANSEHVAVENPVGVMSRVYRKLDQIVQPFYFGHPEYKRTCLWLKGLPVLHNTQTVTPEERIYAKSGSGRSMGSWFAKTSVMPHEERAKARPKTFTGIAEAMAMQWYKLL